MGSYDLYRELELDPALDCADLADILDRKVGELLDEGLSPISPEVDHLVTGRAVLGDPVKRDTYDAALRAGDDEVTVTWLHRLADAPSLPQRVRGSAAFPLTDSSGRTGVGAGDGTTGRLRATVLVLILLGGLSALGVVITVDASQRDAASLYLRVLLGFLSYVACIVAAGELMRTSRR